jgi:hypothetical protein
MPFYTNKSGGPRLLNVKGGAPGVVLQRALAPGETADVELADGEENSPAFKAVLESGELVEGQPEEAQSFDMEEVLKLEQEAVEAREKADAARAKFSLAEMDASRLTPPRQFGSDGGPRQVPTLDGNPGAPTPKQAGGDAKVAEESGAETAEKAEPEDAPARAGRGPRRG